MLSARALPLTAALALSACTQAAVDGTSGGGAPCPVGAHRGDGGACEATLGTWTETSGLSHGRWGHAIFIAELPDGVYLYLAAGFPHDDIERALIHADGALGPWTTVAPFPKLTELAGFVQSDRTLLFVGGMNGDTSLADTLIGTVADDGKISFAPGPSLPAPRERLTLSRHGGFVYAVGGGLETDGGYATPGTDVARAPFDGVTLGAFEALAPLATPRMNHAAIVYGDSLYLIGGEGDLAYPMDSPAVLRAAFTADGKLGPFTSAGALVAGRSSTAAFTFLDQVYLVGGRNKATVLRAALRADGSVGVFTQVAALPVMGWDALEAPLHGRFVYAAGGGQDQDSALQVFVGELE